ncbi:MAG: RloB family protein [Ferruginibacter sp.]
MKNNRAYKKGKGFRDSSLIIIACEGEKTEPKYFSLFERIHPRKCRIEVLPSHDDKSQHNSAPKWLLERTKKYKEENQIGPGDFLFIVSDVDRWKLESIYNVDAFCKEFLNHFLIISNPCFEVWLFYHLGESKKQNANDCGDWKRIVHKKTGIGFTIEKYAANIFEAVRKAKEDDDTPNHFFPKEKKSKVYKIIEAIIDKVGEGNFKAFIEDLSK